MAEAGKVALVTGAAGNVGRAVVALLASRGVHVAALDRGAPPVPEGGGHLALGAVDLLDAAGCDAAIDAVLARFGRLDMAAHTVGGFDAAPVAEADPTHWSRMLAINLVSAVNIARAVSRPMRAAGRGSLVSIGALAALRAPAGLAAYAAAKSGVLRLTESLAEELKPIGVRVNAVLPGTIDTPQNRAAMPEADPALWVTPEQVAEAMVFLLSDAASGVTGALLPVTGRG